MSQSIVARRLQFAVALAATACSTAEPPKPSPINSALTGVWKSDGYGYVLVATGDTLQAFEVTKTTCVASFKAVKQASTDLGAEPQYETEGQVLTVTVGSDTTERHLKSSGAASYMTIRRIATRPLTCEPPTANTPEKNFEVFAQTWAEHYILFDLKGADWPPSLRRPGPR